MHPFSESSLALNSIQESNWQYPDIALGRDGIDYVVSVKSKRHSDEVMLSSIKDGAVLSHRKVSGEGLSFRPTVEAIGDKIYIAWSEYRGDHWYILQRVLENGKLSEEEVVEEGEALFYCSYVKKAEKPILLYSRQIKGKSETVAYEDGKLRTISTTSKTYRPTGVSFEKGYVVVYDAFTGITYDILSRYVEGDNLHEECRLNTTGLRCAQPVVTRVGEELVLGWYENGEHSYFSYVVADLSVEGDRVKARNEESLVHNRNWYNNVSICSNDRYAVFAFTVGKNYIVARTRLEDGSWSKGSLLSYGDRNCGVRPHVALDEKDNLHYVWQFAMMNGHQIRNAQTVWNVAPVSEILKYDDTETEVVIDRFVQPIEGEKDLSSVPEALKKAWMEKNGIEGEVLFGDIHGQSNMSDGMGEIDQYYHYAKVDSRMDFCALTDHDCYPDESTDAEWEFNRASRNVMDGDMDLIALLAYEWTPNEYMHDFGHRNVYYPGREGKLFTCVDPSGMNPDRLYESIRQAGGLCIPHHPAADWTMVSAANDWNYHDEEVEPMAEIFSRHADYEATEKLSKYTKNIKKFPYHCIQDALKRGYHLGFTAGSDSHQMEHGREGGIVGAYMEERSSEALWKALKTRSTFATTGARILVYVDLNGTRMGGFATGKDHSLKVSGVAVSAIRKVEVIKNGNVVYTCHPDTLAFDFQYEGHQEEGEDWYYVRIEQEDDQCCWSSPIWVK